MNSSKALDLTSWRDERRHYEIVTEAGSPIIEVTGAYADACRECDRLSKVQHRKLYVRGK